MPVHLDVIRRGVPASRSGGDDPRQDGGDRDRGAALTMSLVLLVVGGLIVTSLLGYVSTVLRVRPSLEERTATAETARSAVRYAMHQQRVEGVEGCYRALEPVVYNSLSATVECTVLAISYDNPRMRGRYGMITTAAAATDGADPVLPFVSALAETPQVDGDVFISGGTFGPELDVLSTEGTIEAPTMATTPAQWATAPSSEPFGPGVACADGAATAFGGGVLQCVDATWVERAGSSHDGISWSYPTLPPVPPRARESTPVPMATAGGTCNVFFPGYYAAPLVLDGGNYYFASGVYYFDEPVQIRNGASVVAGEGSYAGCLLDADAALDQAAPFDHGISGNGATFLLGGDASLDVDRASLYMNRRLSTPTTRATEGMSIRTVITNEIDTPSLYVPTDQVLPEDGAALVPATTPNGSLSYRGSTLGLGDLAIDVDRTSNGPAPSSSNTYHFVVDGQVFVPNAGLRVTDTTPHYQLVVAGGVTATTVALELDQLPASAAAQLQVGAGIAAVQTVFQLTASVASEAGRVTTSTALFQLNVDGSYAVNSWTLDVGDGGAPPTIPVGVTTTTVPSGGTTTVPPGATTTVPTGPTTTVPSQCDPYEDDNVWFSARPIAVGESQTRELCTGADVDWVAIEMQTDTTYTMTSSDLAPGNDTVFRLYGPTTAEAQLDVNDDYTGGDEGSQITFTPPADGTYFLKVTRYGGNGTAGAYTLTLTGTFADCDAFENDGTWSAAKSLAADEVQQRELCSPTDVDWVQIFIPIGQRVRIHTENLAPGNDTVLKLYSGWGWYLSGNDDWEGGPNSQITYEAILGGWYRLKVSRADGQGPVGAYELRYEVLSG